MAIFHLSFLDLLDELVTKNNWKNMAAFSPKTENSPYWGKIRGRNLINSSNSVFDA